MAFDLSYKTHILIYSLYRDYMDKRTHTNVICGPTPSSADRLPKDRQKVMLILFETKRHILVLIQRSLTGYNWRVQKNTKLI